VGTAVAAILHIEQLAAAGAQHLDDHAYRLRARLDRHVFVRLEPLARLILVHQHRRTGHLELVSLATHRLDEDGQVQFAAARHFKGIRGACLVDAQGDVVPQLFK
jgi:hypothetical protein